MACYHPQYAYEYAEGISFTERRGSTGVMRLPCGNCVGCKLDRASDWAVRCVHEASLYFHNSFLTLTYDDDKIPEGNSLRYHHVQLFLKKLRYKYRGVDAGPRLNFPLRYFAAGEYGDSTLRPHYHLLLFNFRFGDEKPIKKGLYESRELSRLWAEGFSTVGRVSPASAAYVAQYANKKVNGKRGEEWYEYGVDAVTGEVLSRERERVTMSRNPGIGKWWLEDYESDVLPRDYVVVAGRKKRVPRYYNLKVKERDPLLFEEVVHGRYKKAEEIAPEDRTDSRLAEQEVVAKARLDFFNTRSI